MPVQLFFTQWSHQFNDFLSIFFERPSFKSSKSKAISFKSILPPNALVQLLIDVVTPNGVLFSMCYSMLSIIESIFEVKLFDVLKSKPFDFEVELPFVFEFETLFIIVVAMMSLFFKMIGEFLCDKIMKGSNVNYYIIIFIIYTILTFIKYVLIAVYSK